MEFPKQSFKNVVLKKENKRGTTKHAKKLFDFNVDLI